MALTFGVGTARSQPLPPLNDSPAQARKLFVEAQALYTQRRFKEACAKLADSYAVYSDLRTEINLTDCTQQLGKLLHAATMYAQAVEHAKKENSPLLPLVEGLHAKLVKDIPTLTVQVSPTATLAHCNEVTISVDGAPLAQESWGVPKQMDPGDHVV